VLHGDAGSEQFLSEMANPAAYPARHLSMEGIYEYGARVGVWRILREFERRGLPLTVFGVGMALERCPEVTAAFVELGHEIACHGWRWIHYQECRRGHRARAHADRPGDHRTPDGMRSGSWAGTPAATARNTRRLVAEHGGFEYDSDYYGDDLPFWLQVRKSDGSAGAAPGGALHAGLQRHALRAAAGLQPRRRVLRVPARRLRRALRRRRRAAER
jgi:allantoinase